MQCAYDFSTVFGAAVQYFFGGGNVSGPFQYRERMGPNPAGTIQQKCDSVSLTITEITSGDPLEYMDLTNMSFEVGIKRGVNKLGAQQSVG